MHLSHHVSRIETARHMTCGQLIVNMKLLACFVLFGVAVAIPHQPRAPTCGYQSCTKPKDSMLNVHLVPHTHDDVGWLKTVDQYYYGSKNNIQNAGVQYILDSVTEALLKNPARKFIYVETAFFWKWWVDQTPEYQEQVRSLVNNGQLEFISGGWSMNDEATTHYQSTIDQFTYGLRKLNETFGTCGHPRVGWQIDPFGHSREQASLMAQYYFDGLFFARLDYQDKNNRMATKTMEMVWEASPSLGDTVDLFTSALYNFYQAPDGFCFDSECGDEPIIDNPKSFDYNVPKRVDEFLKFLNTQRKSFRTNNIIITMGGDFNYQNAHAYYKNLDKLMRYVNERQGNGSDVNVFYSTPSCYLKAVNDAELSWPTKQDDFFPYASNSNSYWTGYFTSRPTLKYFERLGNNIMQAAKQLAAITGVNYDNLEEMQAAMGIMQHHDAVAGTEKQAVAEDYARLLHKALVGTEEIIQSGLNSVQKKSANSPNLPLENCHLRNISECAITSEKRTFLVTLYNPLSRPVDHYVRLPVQDMSYTVLDPKGEQVLTQILPIPEHLKRIPGRTATTEVELVFKATALPALGYRSYYVSQNPTSSQQSSQTWTPQPNEEVTIGDETVSIKLDPKTKFLKSILTYAETYDVAQSLQYYIGHVGQNNGEANRASGAYIFRPTTQEPYKITDQAETVVIQGDVVHEIHQVFSDWASQIIRHYNDQPVVEFEWLVGPIPVDDQDGKEVISKFTTSIPTNKTFFTDSSGREVLKRQRDYRPTWNLEVHEPVAGNYYPIVSHISFDNGTAGLAIVTDRAQGGSSMADGSLELMVHRRLLHDDAFGVGEAINEQAYGQGLVARGRHFVLIGDTKTNVSTKAIHLLELTKLLDSLVLLSDVGDQTQEQVAGNYNLEWSPLASALPEQVQILTLEPWKDGSLLLRLENVFSVDEEPKPVSVDLNNLFANVQIASARETTLAANQWLDEASRLKWHKESNEVPTGSPKPSTPLALDAIELGPKQIRTFVLTVSTK